MLRVREEFVSFQGEVNVGRLAYFVRLSGCDLACSFCDSKYAWHEGTNVEVQNIFNKAMCFDRVVITGGEPLLQQKEIETLINKLCADDKEMIIEIETNGTIIPIFKKNLKNIIFNVSPKLASSGNNYEKRIIPEVLNFYSKHLNTYNSINFKFVIDNETDIREVEELIYQYKIIKKNVFLMPMGVDRGEQITKLEEIAKYALLLGVNISPRLHILIYGNKRGV